MATDTLDKLRALALDGLHAHASVAPVRPRRRVRDDGLAPHDPPYAEALSREPLTRWLTDGGELAWRRATRPWTPPIDRLVAGPPLSVVARGADVDVMMRNGTQRARGIERPWVAVVVAMLTGRELPAVRSAMRRGVTVFIPEGADPKR